MATKQEVLSIVIPVYNEENFIDKTLDAVLHSDTLHYKKEILVVNDGSSDRTLQSIYTYINAHASKKVKLTRSLEREKHTYECKVNGSTCVVLHDPQNNGKGYAVKQGFIESKGDLVVIQDADLEYDPGDYPLLLQPFRDHEADVVYGSRFVSHKPHRVLYYWHSLGNKFLTLLSNMVTNLNLTDMETGYKVFRGDVIRKLAPGLKSNRFGFEPEITSKLSRMRELKMYEVGVSYWGRTYSDGKKIGWKDGIKAILAILYFGIIDRYV